MKKRSLFAAVAMLIVSAILLTSATYAWFSTGGPAKIGPLKGQAATAGSGVFVKTVGGTWDNAISFQTLRAASGNHFVTNYQKTVNGSAVDCEPNDPDAVAVAPANEFGYYKPLSSDPNSWLTSGLFQNEPAFSCYDLDGSKFTVYNPSASGNKPINTLYDVYDFYVATASEDVENNDVDDTDVAVNLQISGDAAPAMRVAVFVMENAERSGATWTLQGIYSSDVEQNTSNQNTWQPVAASPATIHNCVDVNGNYIADAGDDPSGTTDVTDNLVGTPIAVTAAPAQNSLTTTFVLNDVHRRDGYTLSGTAYSNTRVRVYVWLEGQDAQCVPSGAVSGGDVEVKWSFAVNSANPEWPSWT